MFELGEDIFLELLSAILGTMELPRDELAVPSEYRLRPHDACYPFKRSLAELFSDLSQGSPLAVGQAQTALELISKNSILGNELLVPLEQLLINRSRDVGQHSRPVHRVSSRELKYILDSDI